VLYQLQLLAQVPGLPLQGVNFNNIFARFFRTKVLFLTRKSSQNVTFIQKTRAKSVDEIDERSQFRQINALKSQTVLAIEIVYDTLSSNKTSCPNSNISS
jgi:hypothetical protein